jgi:pimeloyl-ACP methyl ester carboxylesterase
MFLDFHVGVTPWRETWIARRQKRVKGVWDGALERQFIVLRDQRRLTFFLDGPILSTPYSPRENDVNGQTCENRRRVPHIFCFHAMFLSGNNFLLTDPPEEYVLVCINRPGYFGSDPAPPTYTYETFADDVKELADYLRIDCFSVAGHSSGGPCALACAAHIGPKRIVSVGILSGDPEYAHEGIPNKSDRNAFLLGKFLPNLLLFLPCIPLCRQARLGLINDYRLETSSYSFRTEDVLQPALVYVGEDDQVMPMEVSRHVHERLDNSTYRIVPNIGHMGLLRDEVLEDFFENLLALTDHNLEPADEVVEPLRPSRILDDVMDIELVSSTNPSSRSSQVHHRVV